MCGDDVTAAGLFAEHYQKYNVLCRGQRGQRGERSSSRTSCCTTHRTRLRGATTGRYIYNAAGTIDHVVNGVRSAVTPTVQGPSNVTSYSNGTSHRPRCLAS